MRPVGLTSVTFRQLTADQIITLARETGCTGIEWGATSTCPQIGWIWQPELRKPAVKTSWRCSLMGVITN